MHFRFKNKEIENISDYQLLRIITVERKSTCTNIYSPLYKRLSELENKLSKKQYLTK